MDDVPRWMKSNARWISRACLLVVALTVVEQLAEMFTDWIESEWLGVALGFFSAAAIGLDAVVVGVRRVESEGPSIRNLAPGGWACFGAMFWILALPAYFFARRRTRREPTRAPESDPMQRATWRDFAAIVVIAAIGAWAAMGVR